MIGGRGWDGVGTQKRGFVQTEGGLDVCSWSTSERQKGGEKIESGTFAFSEKETKRTLALKREQLSFRAEKNVHPKGQLKNYRHGW